MYHVTRSLHSYLLPQPHTPLYKERSRNNYTLHTPSGYPDGVAQHYTSPFPGVALALALACEGSMYHIKGESTLRMMDTFFTFEIFRYCIHLKRMLST